MLVILRDSVISNRAASHEHPTIAFGPDGTRIVSGSRDETLKVWDAESGEVVLTLRGHGGSVESVAFSPDGTRIVSGSDDKTLKVWDGSEPVEGYDAKTGKWRAQAATGRRSGGAGAVALIAESPLHGVGQACGVIDVSMNR